MTTSKPCKRCGREDQTLDEDGCCQVCAWGRPLPKVTIRFKTFWIAVPNGSVEDFMNEIDAICKQYSGQAYHFRFDVEG